jgi:hypothetical protein
VVPEVTADPAVVKFLTGAGTGGATVWIRSAADATKEPRVRQLLEAFPELAGVQLGPGHVVVELGADFRWSDVLLGLLDHLAQHFAARGIAGAASTQERMRERALKELGRLNPGDRRDLGRLLEAVTAAEPAFREVASELVVKAEPNVAARAWRQLLGDGTRAVRRATVRTMLSTGPRPDLATHLAQCAADQDAYVRSLAASGLRALAWPVPHDVRQALATDPDLRVRVAADAD